MRILITRPEADALTLASHLAAARVEALIEPMLRIAPVAGAALGLDGVQAVLVTSANGARALARATPHRDLPVYAVGEASAACARASGFATVVSAAGDVDALTATVTAELDPASGSLLHVCGRATAGDLAGTLGKAGFTIRRAALYEAHPSAVLSPDCVAALKEETIDAALFFSPRTATTFVRLIRQAALADSCRHICALCLSQAVAEAAAKIEWRRVRVAARPDQESLLELLSLGH